MDSLAEGYFCNECGWFEEVDIEGDRCDACGHGEDDHIPAKVVESNG